MADRIVELRERRTIVAVAMRALVEAKPGAAWDVAAQASYDEHKSEVDRIDQECGRLEDLVSVDSINDSVIERRAFNQDINRNDAEELVVKEHDIFDTFLRRGVNGISDVQREFVRQNPDGFSAGVRAALETGDLSKGGYVAPAEFTGQLLDTMKKFGGVRQVAQVIKTGDGREMNWAKTDSANEEGEEVGENVDVAEDANIDFGMAKIGSRKFSSKVVAVSYELLQDTQVDLVAHLKARLAVRIHRITNKRFTIGDGITQTNGIVTSAGQGFVSASQNAIAFDDLVELEHSVDPAYRELGQSGFMFNDSTLKILKKQKDADGRPLWMPGVDGKAFDSILNYSYTINQAMDGVGAGKIPMIFGHMHNYLVRDVMDAQLLRFDDSTYAKKGQIGFLVFARSDAALIAADDQSIKYLQNAA